MDSHDALVSKCQEWKNYPCNLMRPNQLKSILDGYRVQLNENTERLFNPESESISFFELHDGENSFKEKIIKDSQSLDDHLFQNQNDPRCRFVSIEAIASRSALKCSRQSFSTALSFHQVPSSFLDFSFSFGTTEEPIDYHMTGFQGDNTLGLAPDQQLEIRRLGRSGLEHRVQYLLRSVERKKIHDGSTTWNVRQMAVHHSFDFESGRALWINLKANDLMKRRVEEAVEQLPSLSPTASRKLPRCFAATLAIHLVHLEWCDENWRNCINDTEQSIREILNKATSARVDQQPSFSASPAIKKALTLQGTTSPNLELHDKPTGEEVVCNPMKRLSFAYNALFGKRQTPLKDLSTRGTGRSVSKDNNDVTKQLDSLKVLDTFSISEMQRLHYLGENLESFRVVMELNQQALRDIAKHYEDLVSDGQFPVAIQDGCQRELAEFYQRVERIRKNLEIRSTQVKSLLAWLQDGKSLLDGILQYRSVQVGWIFTESSQIQQGNMEQIAYKTEKETISMHIITFVTLCFLPATFMAAFFQSGLVEINKDATGLKDAVTFHLSAFQLFAMICFPLMLLTFCLWVLLFTWLSRRARPQSKDNVV